MEVSIVRQRVLDAFDRARRAAAERRTRTDEAGRDYAVFLDRIAIPLFRQVANVLRVEKYLFSVSTPSGSVRLGSERTAEDYIEISLDTSGHVPRVMVHTSRAWGRRVAESEHVLNAAGTISEITDEDVLAIVLKELEPFLER